MKPLIILKVGETFSNIAAKIEDFEHWIKRGIGSQPFPINVIDPRREALPSVDDVSAVIVTGSHSMVTDHHPWSNELAEWLRGAVVNKLPVLGICYGHQLLAYEFGGDVGYHPRGIELGTVSIRLTNNANSDVLFKGMPREFLANVVHRQSVLKLPEMAFLLPGNDFEPHHAFRLGDSAWGVQFHPEFSPMAMSGYIEELAKDLHTNEFVPESLLGEIASTDIAAVLLAKFANLVTDRENVSRNGGTDDTN